MYKARCLLVEIEDKGWGGKSFKMNVIRCDLLLMKSSKSQESLTVIQTNTPQFPTNPRRTKQVFCLSNALVSDDEMRFYESLFSTSARNHEKSPLRGLGRLQNRPKPKRRCPFVTSSSREGNPKKERIISLQPTISFKDDIVVKMFKWCIWKRCQKRSLSTIFMGIRGCSPQCHPPQEIRPY